MSKNGGENMLEGKLKDIMSKNVITIKEDINVGFISHMLYRHKINGILIVDKEDEKKIKGIFTTTDLLNILGKAAEDPEHIEEELKKMSALKVGDLGTRTVESLSPEDTILDAIRLMSHKHVHTIPIVEQGELLGIVGRHDILNISMNYW